MSVIEFRQSAGFGASFNLAPREAVAFFRQKGLRTSFAWQDMYGDEHKTAFTVAKLMDVNLLQEIQNAVDEAISQGRTVQWFREQLTPRLQAAGWWGRQMVVDPETGFPQSAQLGSAYRLNTIFRTNMQSAYAAGKWQQIQAQAEFFPYLMYDAVDDHRTRAEHAQWDNVVLPINDVFWDTHAPPNGWNCRCGTIQMDQTMLDEYGYEVSERPKVRRYKWKNPRTGKIQRVPNGIDPGFDFNVGAGSRRKRLNNILQQSEDDFKKVNSKSVQGAQRLWSETENPVFTTVKGVDREGIEQVLTQIPGAEKQVNKLRAFLSKHPVKGVFLKASEIKRHSKASQAIKQRVVDFLGPPWDKIPLMSYTYKNPSKINGFTHEKFEHVVVKVKTRDDLKKINPENFPKAVSHVIDYVDKKQRWTITEAFKEVTKDKQPSILSTWVHEVGHQVHFKAGMPDKPHHMRALTEYSQEDKYEWHAEHFAMWLFNRDALLTWDKEIAEYFDNLIEMAINGS